jgi:YebC/PmpR family DNA-binding regulatory protein
MSGHSKWNNIKHKKEKSDAAKAKVFTRIGKEMAVAIRAGGSNDPNVNSKLRDLIAKAKANNVPNENIERTLKKFSDNKDINFEEITYEGYGPSGVAVIVETATDNRNRTAGNVRSFFSKYHGNMGNTGCVSFMFSEKGVIEIIDEDEEIDEEKLMEAALEAGATDFEAEDGVYTIYTETDDVTAVAEALAAKGYRCDSADRAMVPNTYVSLSDEEDVKFMTLLLEKLEEDDDVTNVFHNWENEEA